MKYILHIFLIFAIIVSYTPIRYLCMKQDVTNMCEEKNDNADDEKTEYEKEIKEFFGNEMDKLYFEAYQSYTHSSFFYLLKNYYVVKENLSPPPECL